MLNSVNFGIQLAKKMGHEFRPTQRSRIAWVRRYCQRPQNITYFIDLNIDVKNVFLCFLVKFKNMFMFLKFFMFFFVLFNVVFLLLLKQKTYKITNMMHFSRAKTPFPGHSECFVAVLLTLFDSH